MRKRKRHSPAQIARKLQDAEAMSASGKTIAETCQALQISKQTLHRWRASHPTAILAEIRRMRALEDENDRLRRIVADQALLIQSLQDAARPHC